MNSLKPTYDFKPCVPGAFAGGLTRAAFFDGMVLSESDLLREQAYWRMKRKLTNRALGQGVVWGLTLDWDPKTRCFTLCPGYGLSCCGDDLVVECPETVCENDLIDTCSEDYRRIMSHGLDPDDPCPKPEGPVEACLLLEYVECPVDPRQVYEDPCAQEPQGCRYGAVRETTRLRLVPPPPPEPASPIKQFCEKIAKIRKELVDAGVDMPDAIFAEPSADAKLSATALDVAENSLGGRSADIVGEDGAEVTLEVPVDTDSVRIGLEPAPGCFFATATVNGLDKSGAQSMLGIFIIEDLAGLLTGEINNVELEVASLLGGDETVRVNYQITASRATDAAPVIVSVEVVSRETVPRSADCNAYLAEWLYFSDDPECTMRTLALAVLCGLFTSTMGTPACSDGAGESPDSARAILAWVVCAVAWRLLFGIDVTDPQAEKVQKCLRDLFAAWCEGFHYKGPRCESNKHGIFLGCVKLSRKGRIICFDEWRHRRYVLTGPLVSHWGGQLGFAPLDVTAARLASWICCVAGTDVKKPSLGDVALDDLIMPLAGGGLLFGKDLAEGDLVRGAAVSRSEDVGAVEFILRTMGLILSGRGKALSTAASFRTVTMPGSQLHLLEASSKAATESAEFTEGAMRAELAVKLDDVPMVARQPMRDFVDAFAGELAIASLKPVADSEFFEPAVAALEEAGVSTVAELVRTGSDPAVELVRSKLADDPVFEPPLAIEKGIAQVFGRAEKALNAAAEAIALEARDRDEEDPFTRGDLEENQIVTAIRKATNANLKGRGLSAAALRGVAAKAIATRR